METDVKTCKGDDESQQTLLPRYARLKANTRRTRLSLDSWNLPKHCAIEIQTSDADPGVSIKEKLAQIRLAEAFQVHNLDLQGRLHYAPGDSRVHRESDEIIKWTCQSWTHYPDSFSSINFIGLTDGDEQEWKERPDGQEWETRGRRV